MQTFTERTVKNV